MTQPLFIVSSLLALSLAAGKGGGGGNKIPSISSSSSTTRYHWPIIVGPHRTCYDVNTGRQITCPKRNEKPAVIALAAAGSLLCVLLFLTAVLLYFRATSPRLRKNSEAPKLSGIEAGQEAYEASKLREQSSSTSNTPVNASTGPHPKSRRWLHNPRLHVYTLSILFTLPLSILTSLVIFLSSNEYSTHPLNEICKAAAMGAAIFMAFGTLLLLGLWKLLARRSLKTKLIISWIIMFTIWYPSPFVGLVLWDYLSLRDSNLGDPGDWLTIPTSVQFGCVVPVYMALVCLGAWYEDLYVRGSRDYQGKR
ncbi:hypothetical protein DL96DRAFT_1715435 [Flagelloscypha sp. PMI_526]|nr:hypothetical protein DL96DRAFT_1715435 [Flagelloscypha sp. PMI_526]